MRQVRARLFRSTIVRMTLAYAAACAVVSIGLLSFVVWSASAFMTRQIDAMVSNELGEVWSDVDRTDDDAVRRAVEDYAEHSPDVFYVMQSRTGALLAGNIQPFEPVPGVGVIETTARVRAGAPRSGLRGRGVLLPSGTYLFVGLSTSDLTEMRAVMLRAAGLGLGVAALIALAGGLLAGVRLLHRLDAISAASAQIMAGDLGRRVALDGSDDEFDRLAHGLNAMLDRIQDLMRGLQQVSSDVAHDLRTPLTRLRQRLELARRRATTIGEFEQAIDAAIGDTEGVLALFAALLRIAQIESGSRRAGFAPVDLSQLLSDLADTYRPELETIGFEIQSQMEPGLIVQGDGELLCQLFANLVENAMRHCPPGTRVTLQAARVGGSIEASVRDDGFGIPPAARQEVLKRFARLERSRTTPGSGLGLSLVAAIAGLHGARLTLGDAHPGLCCTLCFGGGASADLEAPLAVETGSALADRPPATASGRRARPVRAVSTPSDA